MPADQSSKKDAVTFTLDRPKVVAIATDRYLTPKTGFQDPANLPDVPAPRYGQDLSFGFGRKAPSGHCVGDSEDVLIPKMKELLNQFASDDKTGMAKRLFHKFLLKRDAIYYFDDASLNRAAANHENIKHFINAAMSVPGPSGKSAGKIRIHQALENAKWDINKMVVPRDLGVPAFNIGNKALGTQDFGNGLGVMINGLQHAYVVAQSYIYDSSLSSYKIKLKYVFYDVFGLDDEDLEEYGAMSDDFFDFATKAAVGITAWWQLQHTYNYAPLITRIIIEKAFEVSTS